MKRCVDLGTRASSMPALDSAGSFKHRALAAPTTLDVLCRFGQFGRFKGCGEVGSGGLGNEKAWECFKRHRCFKQFTCTKVKRNDGAKKHYNEMANTAN